MPIPPLYRLKNVLCPKFIAEPYSAVHNAFFSSKISQQIFAGMQIAVAVGSRGLANHAILVKATVDYLKSKGAKPFIVAAMGSHGGGTTLGQRKILADFGITETALDVDIKTDMDVVELGINAAHRKVYWDKNAFLADAVITIGRIKPHTDFRGSYESGIVKMMVVGLGKQIGADAMHAFGARGLKEIMPLSAELILQKTKYLGGLAVIENSHDQTAIIEVVDRDDVLQREPELLEQARKMMGRLPFQQLDALIIGEIGKNYSGCGIDPNVVGRYLVESRPDLETNVPSITRIAALRLSPESHGNGVGCGIADLASQQLLDDIDDKTTNTNVLTARFLWRSKKPIGMPTDRDCIEMTMQTCWQPIEAEQKIAFIPNTLELTEIYASEAAIKSMAENIRCNWEIETTATDMNQFFDGLGQINQQTLFPHSHQAKRSLAGG